MNTEPTDAMLDDPLYRTGEKQLQCEECGCEHPVDAPCDEASADDPCVDDGLGDY